MALIPKLIFGNLHPYVFIIGAGVSASCGIPVAKDIFREAMEARVFGSEDDWELVRKLLDYLYPSFQTSGKFYPNVEEFLNQVEMGQRFNSENFFRSTYWPPQKLKRVNAITLCSIASLIRNRMKDSSKQAYIRKFVHEFIQPGDVVITFNWDTTVEKALEDHPTIRAIKDVYAGYGKSELEQGIVLLKPHGSIDWEAKILLEASNTAGRTRRLFDSHPLMVPPISDKDFGLPYMKEIWRSVHDAIEEATTIYVLGFSLPPEDQFARFVIRRAVRNNFLRARKHGTPKAKIVVVNRNPQVHERFSLLFGESFRFRPITFQDFVARLPRRKKY